MNDMTDDTRRELAAGLTAVVRAAMAAETLVVMTRYGYKDERYRALVRVDDDSRRTGVDYPEPPPLTTGQMLGLSALLGGELESRVLADWLTEQGADWAEAVAEKARQEERARCLQAVLDAHNAASSDGLPWDGTGHLIYETIGGEDRQHADAP